MDDAFNCPLDSERIKRADLICITHGHFDHVLDVGRLAGRLGSNVLCSRKVAVNIRDRLGVPETQIQAVTAGETLRRGSIQVEVVRAVHVDNRQYFAEQLGMELSDEMTTEDMVRKGFDGIQDPVIRERLLSYLGKYPGGEQLNYIFRFPGNLKFYFYGSTPDSGLLPLLEAAGAQVLILQVLCGRERGAFEVAQRSGASIIIPSHHDAFFPGQKIPDMEKLKGLFSREPGMTFLDPAPGQWYLTDLNVEG
jgi:L-ascorbate metabolism protein UlaG (beta-lactamase superfamily)